MKKSKKIKLSTALSLYEVHELKGNWEKTHIDVMPNLFMAFDKKRNESKRVVGYRLRDEAYKEILELAAKDRKIEHFVVHLAASAYQRSRLEEIPTKPFFTPILEMRMGEKETHFFPLNWTPNPTFLDDAQDVNSLPESIPGASAYLFILSWLEQPYKQLHGPFMGITQGKNQRVKSYVFATEESNAILRTLQRRNDGVLNLYLGNGIRVSGHPFAFRPVLEIAAHPQATVFKAAKKGVSSGASSYDFSRPSPPYGT